MKSESNSTSRPRRSFLKVVGTGAAAALAGCGSNGGTPTATETKDVEQGAAGTVTSSPTGTPSRDLAKSFSYWDTYNVQSSSARRNLKQAVLAWEKNNNVNVKLNLSSYGALFGQKWVQAFKAGEYPHLYTSDMSFTGKLIPGGWIQPLHIWQDELSDDTLEAVDWAMKFAQKKFSGYGQAFEFPWAFKTMTPFMGRMDHFKQAGLDPEKDFPPKNYEHLIQVAKTLRKDGPAEFGFHVLGDQFDWQDQCNTWSIAAAGDKGNFLNDAWTKVRYGNDAWNEWYRKWAELYTKHNIGGPSTPKASDEDMVAMLNEGRLSMANVEILNHPEFMDRAPKKMKNGTLKWAPSWEGDAGLRGTVQFKGAAIMSPPRGMDEETWEKQARTAVRFFDETILSKEFQAKMAKDLGIFPVRKDVWEQVEVPADDAHNLVDTVFTMRDASNHTWSNHPKGLSIRNAIPNDYHAAVLNGNMSPADALGKMKERSKVLL